MKTIAILILAVIVIALISSLVFYVLFERMFIFRNNIPVKVVNLTDWPLPQYESEGASGLDVRANIQSAIKLVRHERVTIPTGLKMSIPDGYECQVRPRSGLARKNGVIASLGTIDSDYRGEVGITLINTSTEEYIINPGDRVAQIVFAPVEHIAWEEVQVLDETARGEKGFGSTGKK